MRLIMWQKQVGCCSCTTEACSERFMALLLTPSVESVIRGFPPPIQHRNRVARVNSPDTPTCTYRCSTNAPCKEANRKHTLFVVCSQLTLELQLWRQPSMHVSLTSAPIRTQYVFLCCERGRRNRACSASQHTSMITAIARVGVAFLYGRTDRASTTTSIDQFNVVL
jgi:hypothetical protein